MNGRAMESLLADLYGQYPFVTSERALSLLRHFPFFFASLLFFFSSFRSGAWTLQRRVPNSLWDLESSVPSFEFPSLSYDLATLPSPLISVLKLLRRAQSFRLSGRIGRALTPLYVP